MIRIQQPSSEVVVRLHECIAQAFDWRRVARAQGIGEPILHLVWRHGLGRVGEADAWEVADQRIAAVDFVLSDIDRLDTDRAG